MTRDEVLPFVGKYIYAEIGVNNAFEIGGCGFLSIHKTFDFVSIDSYVKRDSDVDEKEFIQCIMDLSFNISKIELITEVSNVYSFVPIHEYFGHEIEGWLSKPLQQVSIDLNKYPHICRKCNSPAWINPVTGHSDCSNINCKGF